jgi:hypothetical protein
VGGVTSGPEKDQVSGNLTPKYRPVEGMISTHKYLPTHWGIEAKAGRCPLSIVHQGWMEGLATLKKYLQTHTYLPTKFIKSIYKK